MCIRDRDKTFAPDGEIAARILKIAQDSGTPCYSTSALRFAAEYTGIDRAGIRAISSWGPGNFETYSIHQLEPVSYTHLFKALMDREGKTRFVRLDADQGIEALQTATQAAVRSWMNQK